MYCCVRDRQRFDLHRYTGRIELIEADFGCRDAPVLPRQIDVAYYLIHAMATASDFQALEASAARQFVEALKPTMVEQVVYLSGIVNDQALSQHLASRKAVEDILSTGAYALTTLRSGIIVGSGSASFEIIRDLVEKLPVMIAPKWLHTRSQPIAIRNVIQYLSGVLMNENTYHQSFDIGGPEVLTYEEMLLQFAEVRHLRRYILVVPVMTPRLSSYWLYFITSTSYRLATNLVDSMKIEVICKDKKLEQLLQISPMSYREAVKLAFDKIEQNEVLSSWTDAVATGQLDKKISGIHAPVFGCLTDHQSAPVRDEAATLDRIWSIGGKSGWYYGQWLWALRGFIDKLFGGVGLRRGRRSLIDLRPGDTLDFWRVLYANRVDKRLLLYAEMKLPGEAWLEFRLSDGILHQTATFRPRGLLGRLYWYAVLPFHILIFPGLLRKLAA